MKGVHVLQRAMNVFVLNKHDGIQEKERKGERGGGGTK